ncbi:hypothetical protein BT96DRAFT_13346 [Gymnopus androsaceus JB14]|uniref:F-box domain-containing protein n=1 Tax=Gymnopus androsaceus JB14 TaxID=1447944 RepID=A0A6A4IU26_9AGAR|nr:hypothetical protein BT96DRAFT_13346 [Gymnopus androsaceus JB14]
MPLIGPHPASFVKRLGLVLTWIFSDLDESEVDLFRRQVIPALNKIAEHAVLCRLDLCSLKIPLDEVIKSQNPIVFGHLREIVIRCHIPNERSLEIFESLCRGSPSLTCLELDWASIRQGPNFVVRLMERIPKVCPNLREIQLKYLNYAIEEESYESIQQVFDDPNFTFPLLQRFHCDRSMNCSGFLERHPGIERLECFNSSKSGFTGVLPNLRLFRGSVTDYLALFSKNPPPVEYLRVYLKDPFAAEEEMYFINALSKSRTLRRLALDEYRITGISLGLLTKACPNLTHFIFKLDPELSAEPKLVYSTILHNLANLEHLDLTFKCASKHQPDHYTSHLQGFSGHHSLNSVHVWSGRKDFYFVKENGEMILVP